MTITLQLEAEVEQGLQQECLRSGEGMDAVANRILRSVLQRSELKTDGVESATSGEADIPERWRGLSFTEIDAQMEIEHYLEALERTRREYPAVRS